MDKNLLFIPGPVPVAEPVLAAMSKPMINHRGPEFSALATRLVERLRPVFGTAAPVLMLGASGTGGLEAAIANTFGPGDTLLACPIGVFGKRLIAIAQMYGCAVEVLETPWGSALDPSALRERLRADTERKISGVLLTHNETSTGAQNDMGAIARVTREFDVLTIVDSVSGMGATEFRMDDWGYDVVVTASQKVFAAPPGLAMLAVSERAWKKIELNRAPRYYFDLLKAREFGAHGETPWTPPLSVMFALDVALERYHREGAPRVWHRHEQYARAIREAFAELGLPVYSQPDAHSVTVVAARVPENVEAAVLLRTLRETRGVVLSGGQLELQGKIVRMGTMGDVSQTDVLGAIGALEIALLELGVPVHIGTGVQAALRVFLNREGVTPGGARSTAERTDAQTTVPLR